MLALLLSGHIVLLFCWGLTVPQNNHWSRHSGNPLGDWSSGSLSASHQLLAPNPTQCGTCHTFRSCSVVCGNHSPPHQSFEAGTVPAVCKSAGYPLAEHPCLTDILSPSTFSATSSRTLPATGSMLHAYNLTCIPVLFSSLLGDISQRHLFPLLTEGFGFPGSPWQGSAPSLFFPALWDFPSHSWRPFQRGNPLLALNRLHNGSRWKSTSLDS